MFDGKQPETVPVRKPSSNVQLSAILLAITGVGGIPLSLAYRRAAKRRAEREARARADMIRQRLEEHPKVARRNVEIRLQDRKAK